MKRKHFAFGFVVLMMLTGCSLFDGLWSSQTVIKISNSYIHEESVNNYYKRSENPYANTALTDTWNASSLSSVGEQKLLVMPIRFIDSPDYGSEAEINANITRAFFGKTSDTGWESLTSYYRKASYGQLHISGEVGPIFNTNRKTSELEKMPTDNKVYLDQTYYVLEDLYNYVDRELLHTYDQNNDGYVDAIFLIFLAPFVESDLFWAFQFYWNRYPSFEKPTFSTYAWASYEFMSEDPDYSAQNPAAHTYIHEFGHILGLDDYYDYDKTSSPLGGNDMMDFNIGDHNMYSKYTLNWSLPYVPTGSSEITLQPAERSGDFILINDLWNGHAYDEYIMIEYYTPTGLNEKDALGEGYGPVGAKAQNFSTPGVRIFHIDARLVYYNSRNIPEWTNVIDANNGRTHISASNTPSSSLKDQTFKRIHLFDAKGRKNTWYHNARVSAGDSALFKTGDKITANEWQKYLFTRASFNNGAAIGYSIEIGEMDENGVTILLTKA